MPEARTGATPKRLALAVEARRLRDEEHLLIQQIADKLGKSRSYASSLLNDPDGSLARARKDSYRLPCPLCGELMDGSNGPGNPPSSCAACAIETQHAERYWVAETIIEALQHAYELTGNTPTAVDLHGLTPSQIEKLSDERRAEIVLLQNAGIRLPHLYAARREFGSWAAAIKAAGLPPARLGGLSHRGMNDRSRSEWQTWILTRLRDGPKTGQELAEAAGKSCKYPLRALREAGLITWRRTGGSRGGIYIYSLVNPEEEIPMSQQFIVFTEHDGTLTEVGVIAAPTRELAAERLAKAPGNYYAVKIGAWQPIPIGEVTKLAVISPAD